MEQVKPFAQDVGHGIDTEGDTAVFLAALARREQASAEVTTTSRGGGGVHPLHGWPSPKRR
jgi:hypothetical protein